MTVGLEQERQTPGRGLRVAFLTNLIPPYQKPVLQALSQRYAAMRVFLSTPMESNRPWQVDWEGLDVVVQKTRTMKGVWRHPRGFTEPLAVHIPLDTLAQLKSFSPDVVISAEMGARTLLALVHRKINPRTRLIVWVEAAESAEQKRGWLRLMARKLFAGNADAFLAVGTSAADYLRSLGVPADKIFKVAYTTSVERFTANSAPTQGEQARRLLFCGQFLERKGLAPFLKVLSQWAADHPARSVNMILAGDGPLRQTLAQLPVATNVKLEFPGLFGYDDLPEIYRAAGIFVLPTLADTWAVVVNEALAAGLPVLGSIYAQAVVELIQEGRNGWRFRPDDPADTYRAIDCVMNTSESVLDQMRSEAQRTARQLSPERVAALIGQAVENCLVR